MLPFPDRGDVSAVLIDFIDEVDGPS